METISRRLFLLGCVLCVLHQANALPASDGPEVIDTGSAATNTNSSSRANEVDEKPEEYWVWERKWIEDYGRQCQQQRPCPRPTPCAACTCEPCPPVDSNNGREWQIYQEVVRASDRCALDYMRANSNSGLNGENYQAVRVCTENAIRRVYYNQSPTPAPAPAPYPRYQNKEGSVRDAYRRGT